MKSKDKKVKKFLAKIGSIKEDVKEVLLKNYLKRCSIRHALAFFQWRLKWNYVQDVSLSTS